MRTFFKIISFIIADIFITTFIVLVLSELTKAGVMGGFGVFWTGLTDVIDSLIK